MAPFLPDDYAGLLKGAVSVGQRACPVDEASLSPIYWLNIHDPDPVRRRHQAPNYIERSSTAAEHPLPVELR
jgi:hypothetical protein